MSDPAHEHGVDVAGHSSMRAAPNVHNGEQSQSGVQSAVARRADTSNSDIELSEVVPSLSRQFGSMAVQARALLLKTITLVPVILYFWVYWPLKDRTRRLLHQGALAFLSISLLFFVAELALKFAGPEVLKYLATELPDVQPYALGLTILAGLIVLWHNAIETFSRTDEHRLSSVIWHLLHRDAYSTEEALMQGTLPMIAKAFSSSKVYRVSVWFPDGACLILKDHCFQQDADIGNNVLKQLPMGSGIAGLVYNDRCPRYVPRVCFPFNTVYLRRLSKPFLHALTFSVVKHGLDRQGGKEFDAEVRPVVPKQKDGKKSKKARAYKGEEIEVVGNRLSQDAVIPNNIDGLDSMHSFVAVPVSTFRGKSDQPLGVLCLDFRGTDPLRTDRVKTAAVFGVLLAMELERLQLRTVPAQSGPGLDP